MGLVRRHPRILGATGLYVAAFTVAGLVLGNPRAPMYGAVMAAVFLVVAAADRRARFGAGIDEPPPAELAEAVEQLQAVENLVLPQSSNPSSPTTGRAPGGRTGRRACAQGGRGRHCGDRVRAPRRV